MEEIVDTRKTFEVTSSMFSYWELCPVLAELMTRVEGEHYEFLFGEVIDTTDTQRESKKNFYAIMNPRFDLKPEFDSCDEFNIPIFKYEGNFEIFSAMYIAILFDSDFGNPGPWNDRIVFRNIGFIVSLACLLLPGDKIYQDYINISSKRPYIQEFIKGVIDFQDNGGKVESQEDFHQLMECYIEKYNPQPTNVREITLNLNK